MELVIVPFCVIITLVRLTAQHRVRHMISTQETPMIGPYLVPGKSFEGDSLMG